MICSNIHNICQCQINYYYFNSDSSSCVAQGTYLSSCSIDYNCRVDRYLRCIKGKCSCTSPTPLWSIGFNKCILPGTYNNACYATSDCSPSESLVCSNGSSCTCPTNMSAGKCDCPIRLYNYEMFWNGSTCTSALIKSQACSANYMCQQLTQGTSCRNLTCECSNTRYLNIGNNKCETLLIINQTCIQNDACNTGLGLSCQSGICKCSSTQFWKSNTVGCINFYNYNNGTCSDSNQCQTGLICKNSTYSSCSCPTTVLNGYCDCSARFFGTEYYYNGSYCLAAKTFNESCSHNSTCQWITRALTCVSNICNCPFNYYWNGTRCVTCLTGW
jgi:hypothetical protein